MSARVIERKKFKGYSVSSLVNEKGEYKVLVMKFSKGKKPEVEIVSCVDIDSAILEYDMIVCDIEMGIYKIGKHVKLTM